MMSSSSQAKNGNIASNDSIEQTISNDECSSLLEHSHSNVSSSSHQHAHASSQRHISEKVPLYARPRQRQRWDETQILPHVNWGDLYFDLFYVAAAYNLSHGFKDNPTGEGFLYFIASYLPIFHIWNEKLVYDSRYCPEDNLFHRTLEVLHLCILGTGVWHIQPSYVMKNTKGDPNTMILTGAFMMDALFYTYLYIDIYWNVDGGTEAQNNAKLEMQRKLMGAFLYGVAFCVAGYDYFLVGSNADENINDDGDYWPAYIILFAYVMEFIVYSLVQTFYYIPRTGRSHKDYYVPFNLEFLIHRVGEWVMLMLGESVLSILTTKGRETWDYAMSFYCGLLTITMFQYLFFRSQPSQAKDHAMRRSQMGGFLFYYMHTIYSAALILVGCSYKMMLSPKEIEEENEEHGIDPTYILEERIALIYAISQTTSFLALDLMLITHRGLKQNFLRFIPPYGRFILAPWLILAANITLLCLTMALSQVRNLTLLSVFGCLLVFGQVILRTLGMKYFPISVEAMDRCINNNYESSSFLGNQRWPNVTEPGNPPE